MRAASARAASTGSPGGTAPAGNPLGAFASNASERRTSSSAVILSPGGVRSPVASSGAGCTDKAVAHVVDPAGHGVQGAHRRPLAGGQEPNAVVKIAGARAGDPLAVLVGQGDSGLVQRVPLRALRVSLRYASLNSLARWATKRFGAGRVGSAYMSKSSVASASRAACPPATNPATAIRRRPFRLATRGVPSSSHFARPRRLEGQERSSLEGSTTRRPRSPAVDVVGWRRGELFDRDAKAAHVVHRQVDPPDEASSATSCQCSTSCSPVQMLSDQASRSGVA